MARRRRRRGWLARLFGGALLLSIVLAVPVAWVETQCRNPITGADRVAPLIVEAAHQRREANSYLTYPEWHIVYAYDGLARTLETGDEYAFDYASSVVGFWRASCALMRAADAHGGADRSTRTMVHIIGVSFTVEMTAKAMYEETIGRATAWWRGPRKTPQDRVVAAMAADYAQFLRQTPWYAYPFPREARALWAAGFSDIVRGWERRLGIGAEFMAKAAYARVLGAAAATDPAPLTIRSVVAGLDRAALGQIDGVTVVGPRGDGLEIETPRYDRFTRILATIARQRGTVLDIAGNDDIMVTITGPAGVAAPANGRVLLRMPRSGFEGERLIVDVTVRDLAALLRAQPPGDRGVEHLFDY